MFASARSVIPTTLGRRERIAPLLWAIILCAVNVSAGARSPPTTLDALKYDEPDVGGKDNGRSQGSPRRTGSERGEEEVGQPEELSLQDVSEEDDAECRSGRRWLPWGLGSRANDLLWVRSDFVFWWTKDMPLPPLATTGPAVTPDVAGVLGQEGTQVLFGDDAVSTGLHVGGRTSVGLWLNPCHKAGLEVGYLGIAGRAARFSVSSDQYAVLARPFTDTSTPQQAAQVIAYPDLMDGSIAIDASTEMQAAEVLWRQNLRASPCTRLDFVAGYRFARLDENLHIAQFSQWLATEGQIIPGTTLQLFDDFATHNQFHGAEAGIVWQRHRGRWSLELLGKLAIGNTRSVVRINGATVATVPDAGSSTFEGGLLAQETNIGSHDRSHVSAIPEVGATLGCALTCRLRAKVGYTMLYWADVARPGEQIDLGVSQFPPESTTGEARPALVFSKSNFWAQGLTLGLEYRF